MALADGKIALVTGGTSGIGKAAATALAKEGAHVTLLVRDKDRGAAAQKNILETVPKAKVDLIVGDIASQASVKNAVETFTRRHPKLHILVHAAGVFLPKKSMTPDGVELTFAINYLGQFQLTNLLLPALKRGAPSRVVVVASRYGGTKIDFDDLNFQKRKFSYLKAVPQSKLAQVLFVQELAARLQGTGVVVNSLHPGLVANTKLLEETRGFFRWLTNRFGGTPEQGADTAVWLATASEAANETGKMWEKRKPRATPGQGSDPEARRRLWAASETLVRTPIRA